MPILSYIFISVIAVIILVNIIRFIINKSSPTLTETAILEKKKKYTHTNGDGMVFVTPVLFFNVEGETIKCNVPEKIYNAVQENTTGTLTHQGTIFRSFEFNGTNVEK